MRLSPSRGCPSGRATGGLEEACSFSSIIMSHRVCRLHNTPFLVDSFWQSSRAAYTFQPVFFLTHFHADHVSGIKDGWEAGPIYCSSITRTLLLDAFKGLDPSVVVRTPVLHVRRIADTLFFARVFRGCGPYQPPAVRGVAPPPC